MVVRVNDYNHGKGKCQDQNKTYKGKISELILCITYIQFHITRIQRVSLVNKVC